MAFDPLLPKTFEQHVSSDGRITTLVRANAESIRDQNRQLLRDLESGIANGRRRENETLSGRSFRPLVKFGTALVIFDTAFIGSAQVAWTEIVRDWLVIGHAQGLAL